MFPVFARARENARRSSCQSNLKQIGLGILQYTQDYDEKLPAGRIDNFVINGTSYNAPWQAMIQPYVKSTQLFKCPSQTRDAFVVGSGNTIPVSYLCSGMGEVGTLADWGGVRPMSISSTGAATGGAALAAMNSTAQIILVGEQVGVRTDPDFYNVIDFTVTPTAPFGLKLQNHLGNSNYLFADGHVKALKPTATGTPINMWNITNTTLTTDTQPGPAPNNLLTKLAEQQQAMN